MGAICNLLTPFIVVDGLKMTSTSTKPRAAVGNTTAVSTGNKRKLKNDAEGSGSRKHRVLSVQDKTVAPEILAAMKEQPLDGLEVSGNPQSGHNFILN